MLHFYKIQLPHVTCGRGISQIRKNDRPVTLSLTTLLTTQVSGVMLSTGLRCVRRVLSHGTYVTILLIFWYCCITLRVKPADAFITRSNYTA